MAVIAATNSTTPSLQAVLGRGRLEQARREAHQAEANAQNLRAQADDQERIVAQAHQRVNTLEGYSRAASDAASTANKPSSEPAGTAAPNDPTYSETLDSVLQAAKALTNADYLSETEKNIVTSNLLKAAAELWSSSAPNSRAIRLYGGQDTNAAHPSVGRVVNATV